MSSNSQQLKQAIKTLDPTTSLTPDELALLATATKRDRDSYRDLKKAIRFREKQYRKNVEAGERKLAEVSQLKWISARHRLHQLERKLKGSLPI